MVTRERIKKGSKMQKRSVFLSYCRDNRKAGKKLHDELVKAGFDVWWDQDIGPGQDWKREIRAAMKRSFAIIACFSKEVVERNSSGVYPELRDAIAEYRKMPPGSVFIVPVRLSECNVPDLDIDDTRTLEDLNYVDLFPSARRSKGLRDLVESLGKLRPREEAPDWQQMDLNQAQEEFEKQLDQMKQVETLQIRHIGLDMSQAQDRLILMLSHKLHARTTTIQLLVIADDVSKFHKPIQRHLKSWIARVAEAVDHIKKRLEADLHPEYEKRGQHLSIEIKSYAEAPSIHGFSLYEGEARVATYFSFCRWVENGEKFDWGDEHYRKILEPPADKSSEDMIAIFEGAFAHLWGTGTPYRHVEIGKPRRSGRRSR